MLLTPQPSLQPPTCHLSKPPDSLTELGIGFIFASFFQTSSVCHSCSAVLQSWIIEQGAARAQLAVSCTLSACLPTRGEGGLPPPHSPLCLLCILLSPAQTERNWITCDILSLPKADCQSCSHLCTVCHWIKLLSPLQLWEMEFCGSQS